MKAGPVEIGTLLQNRNRYCVPIYQRRYVWTKNKQWEPFWQDIRTKAIERLAGRERRFSHFMGAVVLESRAKPSVRQVPSFQVVDGQQRLTTFQMFLTAARHYAQKIGYSTAASNIQRFVMNSDPQLMEQSEVEVYKVWPTQGDREIFIDIVSSEDRAALRKKHGDYWYKKWERDQIAEYNHVPNLLGAYGYFYDRIRHSVETDDLHSDLEEVPEDVEETEGADDEIPRELKLDAIWQALLEEFKVVEIVLDEGDDAQVIFETLNDRGEPLLAADLIRNNIFQRADANIGPAKAEKLFSTHWGPFDDPFWSAPEKQGRYKKQRIEFFLANFIAGKIASDITISKLFSEYKAFLRPSKDSMKPRYSTVEDEILDLKAYGAIYREFIERETNSALSDFSRRLRLWDVTTANPLVLRLWASGELSAEEKKRALDFLLSFIVRRAVCGLTNKNYNNLFLSAIAHVDKMGWTLSAFRRFFLDQKSDSGRFPRDDEFRRMLANSPIYRNLGSAKTRALLSAVEQRKRGKFQETQDLPDGLSVEHIMPSAWRPHWPMMNDLVPSEWDFSQALYSLKEDESASGQIVRRNRLKDTIGNLTLVTPSFNSRVSNEAFDVKRKEFDDQSVLMMTRDFVKKTTWCEVEIEERGKAIALQACEIWPSQESDEKPLTDTSRLASADEYKEEAGT
ncbi:DUF262 domain-containing protein [Agrobacterium tumefaciens]|uniref:DUF262 domain-containing protein n=1 Tax=Agrobacterium tumefaciens TaxID=358 RepID=UPI001AE8FFC4|nr:DUF262 domain-containing protein [Agrobacterium tumefaciens]MBP2534880.1 uncharacterized protein with ParB-like and HNH nuclease domain [Agrobacterium tumefaciens]